MKRDSTHIYNVSKDYFKINKCCFSELRNSTKKFPQKEPFFIINDNKKIIEHLINILEVYVNYME